MIDATRCPDPDALLVLLYDDEGDPAERATLEAHVARCRDCAQVLTGLDSTRGMLGAWHAPRVPLGFAIVRTGERSRFRPVLQWGGLAAAAVLVLAVASSVARIEITYGPAGFSVRTGGDTAIARTADIALPERRSVQSSPASGMAASEPGAWVQRANASDAPWRADLELLATQLRGEFSRLAEQSRPAAPSMVVRASLPAAASAPDPGANEALLRRFQELLDQSEVRQQQNLALRVTELGRQFQIQRQSDIEQMEQTLTRIEQQRNELLRRVTATQPRP